jgi:3',5'-cyclic-nucleotide phosphodiesterase
MKLRVLGAFGAEAPGDKRASSFLLDERTLIDAGSVTGVLPEEEQAKIERVLISHTHLDHVAGLAYLSEARATCPVGAPLAICSIAPVLQHLQRSFFNNVLWPDFAAIPTPASPAIRYEPLIADREQELGELRVTAVPVNHTVEATGFVIRDGRAGLVYSGDTGPTYALWREMAGHPEVRSVLLECSFPNRLEEIARAAKHLTPRLLEQELRKLPARARVLVFHVKPQFVAEVTDELAGLGSDRVVVARQGETYDLA